MLESRVFISHRFAFKTRRALAWFGVCCLMWLFTQPISPILLAEGPPAKPAWKSHPVLDWANGVAPKAELPDSLRSLGAEQELAADTTVTPLTRVVPNRAFFVGEKLYFKIKYGLFRAGSATMEVLDSIQVSKGRTAYRIRTTARSSKFFDWFYKVRDSVETYLDTRGMFSWRFYKRLREGGFKFDLLAEYNQTNRKARVQLVRYHNETPLRVRKKEVIELPLPPYVLDVLASFYYVRTQPLEVGMPLFLPTHNNRKVYIMQVIVQKEEVIRVAAGTFRCLKLLPRLQGEAIFKQKGRLWVWVTDDELHIPVLMKSKVAVGQITTELYQMEGVKGPLPSRIE
ncbi:MAG: DUF3108 domain-containing protein [Calditrichaeota bacterium]|nr:MAG: DUF3108 domain-containing protein [Calditrichota bacterium]